MNLHQTEILLRAAEKKAGEIGIAVSIAVLDAGTHLKAFSRMDGAWLGSIEIALNKARTAVLFEVETEQIWEFCKPGSAARGLESTNGGLITFAGGIPLTMQGGQLVGAIGVSGGQVPQDLEVARAARAAFDAL